MMQPRFDDLIKYVRAGESDPEMQKLLTANPDGQELLKQARFICKVLQDRYAVSGDYGDVADADMAWGGLTDVSAIVLESREPEDRNLRALQQAASIRKPRRRRPPSIGRLLADIDSARQDLGTLSLAVDEQRVSASYQPSLVVASYAEKFLRNAPASQLGLPGVQIQSMDLNISLQASIAVGEPVPLRLSRSIRQTPAKHLELVFMPESGPFVHLVCDDEGNTALPAPIQSGVLRVGSSEPRFLRIKVDE